MPIFTACPPRLPLPSLLSTTASLHSANRAQSDRRASPHPLAVDVETTCAGVWRTVSFRSEWHLERARDSVHHEPLAAARHSHWTSMPGRHLAPSWRDGALLRASLPRASRLAAAR